MIKYTVNQLFLAAAISTVQLDKNKYYKGVYYPICMRKDNGVICIDCNDDCDVFFDKEEKIWYGYSDGKGYFWVDALIEVQDYIKIMNLEVKTPPEN